MHVLIGYYLWNINIQIGKGMAAKTMEFTQLKGILSGLTTDQKINEKELLFLDAWLKERSETLGDDGDVVDLLEQIADVLEDGIITNEEMLDTLSLIDCILKYRNNPPKTKKFQEIIGFVQGVVSDNVVADVELKNVMELLSFNNSVPICALLNAQLSKAESNGEKLSLLKSFCGHYFEETGSTQAWSSYLADTLPDDYVFIGKRVCFTGDATGFPRSVLKSHLNKIGGILSKTVSKSTDVLVVGDGCSKGWLEHNFGTKLDAACKLKLGNHGILIVSADEWIDKTRHHKDPLLSKRNAALTKFGTPKTLDEVFERACEICKGTRLHAVKFKDENNEGVAVVIGSSSYQSGEYSTALIQRKLNSEYFDYIKPWSVSGEDQVIRSYSKPESAFENFAEHLALITSSAEAETA